jgi:Cof subfamily protein (haloacid dehalogenase superfamily)
MKYKLIASDLDGTLLDSSRKVSQRTRELIKEFTEKGGVFTFATGRMEASVKRYLEELDISSPVIIYNGAKIVDIKNNIVIYENLLSYDSAKAALRLAEDYDWDVLLYLEKKIYVNKITDVIKEYMLKDGVCCKAVGNLHEFLKLQPTKILIIGNPDYFAPYTEKLQQHIKEPLNYVISEYNYLEILPDGCSKGNALTELAKSLGIPIEQTIALGDNLNDVSMVEAAGLGVAVENAHEMVKECADYITSRNDEDGVAEVIYRVVNRII